MSLLLFRWECVISAPKPQLNGTYKVQVRPTNSLCFKSVGRLKRNIHAGPVCRFCGQVHGEGPPTACGARQGYRHPWTHDDPQAKRGLNDQHSPVSMIPHNGPHTPSPHSSFPVSPSSHPRTLLHSCNHKLFSVLLRLCFRLHLLPSLILNLLRRNKGHHSHSSNLNYLPCTIIDLVVNA